MAVVGTGASAIQFVPAIVDKVGSLTVFQRSAPYVVPKPDTEYKPRHHKLFERYPATMRGERGATFLLTEQLNKALEGESLITTPMLTTLRAAWRAQLRFQVKDEALRARLVPDYPIGCKRILFSNDWYPALDRDHVSRRHPRRRLGRADRGARLRGHAARGRRDHLGHRLRGHRLPALDPGDRPRRRRRCTSVWRDGATAYLGVGVPGFPNLFCVYGPNTNLGGSSIIAMMEAQAGWIAQVARRIADTDHRAFEVRADVAAAYDREMQGRLGDSVWAQCENWYTQDGKITTNWPGQVSEYQQRLARVDWQHLVATYADR